MPRAADGKGACSDLRRRTTTMIGIGIVFSVVGLGYLCWALFDLIVYALPAVVGVSAGFAAYHRRPDRRRLHPGGGAGRTRDIPIAEDPHGHRIPLRRAGRLGGLYEGSRRTQGACMLTLGMAQLGVPSLAWQQAFALFGSMVVGATAWERMMQQSPPEPPGGQ
jgi:hypothetical protein